ncbi:MAG: hypothetical protein ACT4PW_12730 [Acidimicrobiia bacterium]
MPAGFLILLVLAAVTFDYAHLHLRQRELVDAAEAAANDAAAAIDSDRLRAGAGVRLDPVAVDRVVAQSVRAHAGNLPGLVATAEVIDGGLTVRVTASARVDYVFVKAIPGGPRSASIDAIATASPNTRGLLNPP